MSKKRLEKIKYYYREMETLDPADINWLIKQAERVQELEKELRFGKITNYILKEALDSEK